MEELHFLGDDADMLAQFGKRYGVYLLPAQANRAVLRSDMPQACDTGRRTDLFDCSSRRFIDVRQNPYE